MSCWSFGSKNILCLPALAVSLSALTPLSEELVCGQLLQNMTACLLGPQEVTAHAMEAMGFLLPMKHHRLMVTSLVRWDHKLSHQSSGLNNRTLFFHSSRDLKFSSSLSRWFADGYLHPHMDLPLCACIPGASLLIRTAAVYVCCRLNVCFCPWIHMLKS